MKSIRKFQEGKTYVFVYKKAVKQSNMLHRHEDRVTKIQNVNSAKPWMRKCNGRIVEVTNDYFGYINGFGIDPEQCKCID